MTLEGSLVPRHAACYAADLAAAGHRQCAPTVLKLCWGWLLPAGSCRRCQRVNDCTADHRHKQRTHDEQRGHWRLSAELDTEDLPPADDPLSSAEMPQPLTTQWPGETP